MKRILQITNDSLQKQRIILADGTSFQITLSFKPMQLGWYIQSLVYGNFVVNGLRVCISPNMLHQFKNQIPFGIACFSPGSREPSLSEDFSSGTVKMYLLNAAEVAQYARFLSG